MGGLVMLSQQTVLPNPAKLDCKAELVSSSWKTCLGDESNRS